jgi:hypothetical protein
MIAKVQAVRINPRVIRIHLRLEKPTPFRWIKATMPQVLIPNKTERLERLLKVEVKLVVQLATVPLFPIRPLILQQEVMPAGQEAVRGISTVS